MTCYVCGSKQTWIGHTVWCDSIDIPDVQYSDALCTYPPQEFWEARGATYDYMYAMILNRREIPFVLTDTIQVPVDMDFGHEPDCIVVCPPCYNYFVSCTENEPPPALLVRILRRFSLSPFAPFTNKPGGLVAKSALKAMFPLECIKLRDYVRCFAAYYGLSKYEHEKFPYEDLATNPLIQFIERTGTDDPSLDCSTPGRSSMGNVMLPITIATLLKDKALVESLIRRGARPIKWTRDFIHKRDTKPNKSYHECVCNRDACGVDKLLSRGQNPQTHFAHAVSMCWEGGIILMIKYGAVIDDEVKDVIYKVSASYDESGRRNPLAFLLTQIEYETKK